MKFKAKHDYAARIVQEDVFDDNGKKLGDVGVSVDERLLALGGDDFLDKEMQHMREVFADRHAAMEPFRRAEAAWDQRRRAIHNHPTVRKGV